jgi:hypothetical protein
MLSACMTPAERARLQRQLDEYRVLSNKTLKNSDFKAVLDRTAREDPEFDRIHTARVKDWLLEKRTVTNPKIRKTVWPSFPQDMQRNWKEAYLYFALIIGPSGSIESIRYLPVPQLDAHDSFVYAAKEALDQWEFEPGYVDGKPSEYTLIIPIIFRVTDPK